MSFRILGLGTALPVTSIEQSAAMEFAKQFSTQTDDQRRLLPVLYRRTGVKRRHSVLLESASETAAPASSTKPQRIHLASTDADTATIAAAEICSEENITQSFYPPAQDEHDDGPGTAARMQCYEQHAGELACRAAKAALVQAGVDPAQITHLVTVSCTGFHAPGVDLTLIRELGLPAETARSHIGFMGCHGALNGLRVARAFAESQRDAYVLVVAVELCSLHQQYGWHPDRIVANALFADGAAAIVGCASHASPVEQNHTTHEPWCVVANGSLVLPASEDMMSWRIGDHGFQMTLSPCVPDMIRESLKPWLSQWLKLHNLTWEQIGSWAIHPGGPRILSACGEALELTPEQLAPSRDILARYGNMSSPTVLFILNELMKAAADRPCVALAFGPGLAIEALLIR